MNRRHCIVIYKEDYPWDVRIEKLANSLLDFGNKVTIVARNVEMRARVENQEQLRIVRLPCFRALPKILRNALSVALWFNPFWISTIFSVARAGGGSPVFIVRDLPLVASAMAIRRVIGGAVILDMAECYPEMFASTARFRNRSISERLLKNVWVATRYERYAVKRVDHTLVMIEESKSRLTGMGVKSGRATIVSNTPAADAIPEVPVTHAGSDLRLVYVGFLTRLRGLDIMLDAIQLARIREPGVSVWLDIVGVGPARNELLKRIRELDLGDRVQLHGWLEIDAVRELMSAANVGSLTYRVCGHWNHTIPNKIFDYMAAGLPVIATNVVPVKRILDTEKCGIVCADGDSDGIASALIELSSPARRRELGANGRRAVIERYNWKRDEASLRRVIDSL